MLNILDQTYNFNTIILLQITQLRQNMQGGNKFRHKNTFDDGFYIVDTDEFFRL